MRLMEQVWELAQKNWSEGQTIRILGDDGNTQGMKVDPLMLEAEFELSLEVGSVVPYDRERRKAESLEIFNVVAALGLPELALKHLLEAYDVPNAKEILDAIANQPVKPPEKGGGETETVAASETGGGT